MGRGGLKGDEMGACWGAMGTGTGSQLWVIAGDGSRGRTQATGLQLQNGTDGKDYM